MSKSPRLLVCDNTGATSGASIQSWAPVLGKNVLSLARCLEGVCENPSD